ncbi:MAG: hypothetical protein JNK65_06835 [Deltaproteobacteria bacterium]|nr:hypothetical protein [Deltaproteobacteria bacterium]
MPIKIMNDTLLSRLSAASCDAPTLTFFQQRVDQGVQSFVQGLSNTTLIASAMIAPLAFQGTRLAAMHMLRSIESPLTRQVFSYTAGWMAESLVFEGSQRLLSSQPHPHSFWRSSLQTGFTLAPLKFAGFLAREQNFLIQQLGMDFGILLGQEINQALGLESRSHLSTIERLVEAQLLNTQLGLGLSLARSLAPRLFTLERGMSLHSEFVQDRPTSSDFSVLNAPEWSFAGGLRLRFFSNSKATENSMQMVMHNSLLEGASTSSTRRFLREVFRSVDNQICRRQKRLQVFVPDEVSSTDLYEGIISKLRGQYGEKLLHVFFLSDTLPTEISSEISALQNRFQNLSVGVFDPQNPLKFSISLATPQDLAPHLRHFPKHHAAGIFVDHPKILDSTESQSILSWFHLSENSIKSPNGAILFLSNQTLIARGFEASSPFTLSPVEKQVERISSPSVTTSSTHQEARRAAPPMQKSSPTSDPIRKTEKVQRETAPDPNPEMTRLILDSFEHAYQDYRAALERGENPNPFKVGLLAWQTYKNGLPEGSKALQETRYLKKVAKMSSERPEVLDFLRSVGIVNF